MSSPDRPGILTSRMMQAGPTVRAFASSEAPSAKQVVEYPACENTIDSILRIAGSSSTMKISPLEGAASAIYQTSSEVALCRRLRPSTRELHVSAQSTTPRADRYEKEIPDLPNARQHAASN